MKNEWNINKINSLKMDLYKKLNKSESKLEYEKMLNSIMCYDNMIQSYYEQDIYIENDMSFTNRSTIFSQNKRTLSILKKTHSKEFLKSLYIINSELEHIFYNIEESTNFTYFDFENYKKIATEFFIDKFGFEIGVNVMEKLKKDDFIDVKSSLYMANGYYFQSAYDSNKFIQILSDNTIEDLDTLIHELGHFIDGKSINDEDRCNIYLEIVPIFCELLLPDYLVDIGFDKKDILDLKYKILSTRYNSIMDYNEFYDNMKNYKKNGIYLDENILETIDYNYAFLAALDLYSQYKKDPYSTMKKIKNLMKFKLSKNSDKFEEVLDVNIFSSRENLLEYSKDLFNKQYTNKVKKFK
ncbi:MAG: hypothetical protein ACK5HL_03750 [Bacilli bacterium]